MLGAAVVSSPGVREHNQSAQ